MPVVSSNVLCDALRYWRLLPPDRLAQVPHIATREVHDVRRLAKALLQRDWLTVFQVNQLLAGNGHKLVLGPYHILDRLGAGGQSQVFKARHAERGWTVALKVLRTEALESAEARQQFLAEMEAMARMDHPNVVQFCDVDRVGQTFYCAMEYVEGSDLGRLVALESRLPASRASEYVRQAALGLQHAHEHNLVHRDIKPVNLFLTNPQPQRGPGPAREGVVKILDWGLAWRKLPGAHPRQRPAQGFLGTADYLSPEQARDANGADIRSDLYSLGCTLYHLLAGQVPFPGNTLMQKLMQHQGEEPVPVETHNRTVPPGLSAALRRLMAKKPEDRFQTPAAVALALAPYCRKDQPAVALPRACGAPAPAGHGLTPVPFLLRPRPPAPLGSTDIPTRPNRDTPGPNDTSPR